MRPGLLILLSLAAGVAAQDRRTFFKRASEELLAKTPVVPKSLDALLPKIPRNVPKLKIALGEGPLRLPASASAAASASSNSSVTDSPVCKTQTDTTTIEDCSFKIETTIYCSASDTWGGVKVTEKASGESVETDTTHCSGDSDCEDKMTKLASEAIAYLYKYSLGQSISDVEGGVCSCGVTTTTTFGENFYIGLCLTFDSYKNLEDEEASFKAYAKGDRDDSHIGYTYDFNCKDEGYGDNVTECVTAVGTVAVTNALSTSQMSGTGGMYSTGGYPVPDAFSGEQDDDNDKVLGDGPVFCPYGTSDQKVAYFVAKGGDKGKLYLCTMKGVTSDPAGGFGGMFQLKDDRRRLRGAEDEPVIVGDNNYDNPWTGDTSCPDGFEDSKTWKIISWDNQKTAYVHFCNGKGGAAGLIAGGYQSSDSSSCDKTNHYTGEKSCPDGYTGVKVAKGDCGDNSSEMYVCYNEDQL